MKIRTPTLPRLFLSTLLPPENRDLVLADLKTRFIRQVAERGRTAAWRWYWWQVLRAVPMLFSDWVAGFATGGGSGLPLDLRIGIRGLRKSPLFAIGVASTLALGLVSVALVFNIAWYAWLAPLPFPDSAQVVRLREVSELANGEVTSQRLSPPLLEDLRSHEWVSMESVAGVTSDLFDWTVGGRPQRVRAVVVSPDLFSVLRIQPMVGRALTRESASEVVLSERFWRSAFGADRGVVDGRIMTLNGVDHQIVGVAKMPSGYPQASDILTLLTFEDADLREGMRWARYLDAVARVRPGHTVDEASAEFAGFIQSLSGPYPMYRGWSGTAINLGEDLAAPSRGVLALLLTASLAFLVLAVVNVAGLMAARHLRRQPEVAVRIALGAPPGRVFRGTLIESLLLGGLGGALSLVLVSQLLPLLVALAPDDLLRLNDIGLRWWDSTWILLSGVILGAVVGLGSLMLTGSPVSILGGGHRSVESKSRGRWALVVLQIGLTTLLATGGVTVLRHTASLRELDLGFNPNGLLSTGISLSEGQYPGEDARYGFWSGVIEALEAQGIPSAVATNPTLSGSNMRYGFLAEGATEQGWAQYHAVSAGYFSVMDVGVLEGRSFNPGEQGPVIVISEALAQEHFPSTTAIGHTINLLGTDRDIVAVVESTRHFGPGEAAPLEIYIPLSQDVGLFSQILVREQAGAETALARTVTELAPSLDAPNVVHYEDYIRAWFAPIHLQLVIVGFLAAIGGTLASLGLYALVAYHVRARRREMGIRRALGAPAAGLVRMVVAQGMAMTAVGVALGWGGWYVLAPTLTAMADLPSSSPFVTLTTVTAGVGFVAFLATLIPARATTLVDPMESLRIE